MNRTVTIASVLIAVALIATVVFEFAEKRGGEGGEMSVRPDALSTTTVVRVQEAVSREPRDLSAFDLFSGRSNPGAALSGSHEVATVEDVLALGLEVIGASPTHIAFRGTASANSVRCDWRGIARTPTQREDAIRLWFRLDEDDPIPDAELAAALFGATLDVISPNYRETAKSNFNAIAMGGLSSEYMFLTCYANYTVSEYLLGDGPAAFTVAYDRMDEARSYDLHLREHEEGQFGDVPLDSREDYEASLGNIVADAELSLKERVGNRESVVFLAPMGDHNAIAVEAWQAVAQWDVQRADDGTVNAVRYGASSVDPERSQTLANLKSRVSTATAPPDDQGPDDTSATSTPARIGSVGGLKARYRSIGAYGDISPGDSSSATFTPAQPPPLHVPPPTTVSASKSGDNGASLSWSAASGAAGYYVQRRVQGDETAWTPENDGLTSTSLTVSDLRCSATHEFRVGAYGNGTSFSDRTGLWSDAASLTIGACPNKPPKFEADSYTFRIDALTPSGAVVGTVSATDANGDAASYSFADLDLVGSPPVLESAFITSGDEAVRLVINPNSGELKIFGPARNLEVPTHYDMFLGASDGKGGRSRVATRLLVRAPNCLSGEAVENPLSRHWLVQDCEALLAVKDALRGTASLDWSPSTAVSKWDGVTVSGTPQRVTKIDLRSKGLNGALPAGVGSLSKLSSLRLGGNSLSGAIPSEIGGLSKLETLGLANNGLSGDVPESLGGLSKLKWLRLLTGNSFTGCVPRALRDVDDGDLSSSVLPFCNNAPEFGSDAYSFTVAENAAVGSAAGTAAATDADGDSITYSISAGNAGGEFAIDAATGAITLASALDYEKAASHALTVTANDGNHAGTDTASVTVSVTDVLDTLPSAPTGASAAHSDGTFTVSWNAVAGADLYRARYIVRGAFGEWTYLPTTTGTTLAYAASCGKTYEFRVEARGDGTSRLARWSEESAAASASGDACNNPPAFEKASYSFIALETLASVGAVYAADADGETVSYSIASGNADGKFSLSVETRDGRRQARLQATSPFDYETKAEYSLTIRATDTRGGAADASVRVVVRDVSENPPVALNNLSAAVSGTTVTLSWTRPADDLITGYRLTRRAQGSETVATIEIKGAATTSYADSGLSANTKYIYRVHAIDYFNREGAATRTTATTGAADG